MHFAKLTGRDSLFFNILKTVIGASILLMCFSGCLTSKLFEGYEYDEEVSSVLISHDQESIVVIGRNYHYVFKVPATLVSVIESPIHRKVKGELNSFNVDSSNHITGQIGLALSNLASKEEIELARGLGFVESRNDSTLRWSTWIEGARYSAEKFPDKLNSYKLNQSHRLKVRAEQSTMQKASKAPLTPITLTLDGVVAIGGVVLAPILVPMWVNSRW